MSIKIKIPTPLRKITQGTGEVEISGKTIDDIINGLEKDFPGIKERLCDESGELRRFVNIYVNQEDIRFMRGKETPLKDGDEVSIVPAIAGGSAKSLKFHITFPEQKIKEPIIYQIGKDFQIITNIRKADVDEKTGWMDLELTGEIDEIEKAVSALKKRGVTVDPIERDIIE
ncbi:MAG: MoaD family protein [Nitrospirae bacterium]|nr:MoaD family protein [Nitrospirota bacterium]MBI3604869.1 MoaD family protein [Nitrospirota bacterium]